jgi:serine/threonine protein kinase
MTSTNDPTGPTGPGGLPEAAEPPVRARIGRYEVIRRLARGGMAEVFLARSSGPADFAKTVVLKRVLPGLGADRRIVRMFLDEARTAALLHHSNIVQIFDFGEVDGEYFIVMELLEGLSLAAVLDQLQARGAALPLDGALVVARDVCAGLHYAHEQTGPGGGPLGIVHRDVSPQNVMITWHGEVKLVDFGIAKAAHNLARTVTGMLKGKVRYMSPEQAGGGAVDRRSDVFSLGVVLWELTVGQRLVRGQTELETLQALAGQDVPAPSTFRPGYPPALEEIVLRALQREPAARFQTARALQEALERFAAAERLALSGLALARLMEPLRPACDATLPGLERASAAPTRASVSGVASAAPMRGGVSGVAPGPPPPGDVSGVLEPGAPGWPWTAPGGLPAPTVPVRPPTLSIAPLPARTSVTLPDVPTRHGPAAAPPPPVAVGAPAPAPAGAVLASPVQAGLARRPRRLPLVLAGVGVGALLVAGGVVLAAYVLPGARSQWPEKAAAPAGAAPRRVGAGQAPVAPRGAGAGQAPVAPRGAGAGQGSVADLVAAADAQRAGDPRRCIALTRVPRPTAPMLGLRFACAMEARDLATLRATCAEASARFPNDELARRCPDALRAMGSAVRLDSR